LADADNRVVLRWLVALVGLLALLAGITVVGAITAPDAMESNGSHGWLPWATHVAPMATLVMVVWVGLVATRRGGWFRKVVGMLATAAVVLPLTIVAVLTASGYDKTDDRTGLECRLSDNTLGCHNSVYADYAVASAFLEVVVLGLLVIVALAFGAGKNR
jgi:hypothetical protein